MIRKQTSKISTTDNQKTQVIKCLHVPKFCSIPKFLKYNNIKEKLNVKLRKNNKKGIPKKVQNAIQ